MASSDSFFPSLLNSFGAKTAFTVPFIFAPRTPSSSSDISEYSAGLFPTPSVFATMYAAPCSVSSPENFSTFSAISFLISASLFPLFSDISCTSFGTGFSSIGLMVLKWNREVFLFLLQGFSGEAVFVFFGENNSFLYSFFQNICEFSFVGLEWFL